MFSQHSWLISIIHSCNEWYSSPVRGPILLASHQRPVVPGNPHRKKTHYHTTGLNLSSTLPSVISEYLRPPTEGTTHEVGNNRHGNGRDDGSRISRGKQNLNMTIPTSLTYNVETYTNDNSFCSERYNLLGSLYLGNIPLTRATVPPTLLGDS